MGKSKSVGGGRPLLAGVPVTIHFREKPERRERKQVTEEGEKHAYLLLRNHHNEGGESYRLIGIGCQGGKGNLFSAVHAKRDFGTAEEILKDAFGILFSEEALREDPPGLFYTKTGLQVMVESNYARVVFIK